MDASLNFNSIEGRPIFFPLSPSEDFSTIMLEGISSMGFGGQFKSLDYSPENDGSGEKRESGELRSVE